MDKERLWTRDFSFVFVINFLTSVVFYLLMISIAPYAITRFDASSGTAGLATGIFIVGCLFGRFAIAGIIDTVGSKRILLAGVACNLAMVALYLLSFNLPLLIANRFLHGIVSGICTTTTGTLIAQMVPPQRRGEAIGFYSLSAILGAALGPFIAMPLIHAARHEVIFLCSLALVALTLVLAGFVRQPVLQFARSPHAKVGGRLRIGDVLDFSALPIAVVGTIVALSYSGLLAFISVYSREIDLVGPAGFFFLVYSVAVLVSRPFSGRLLDRRGANIVVYPALVVHAIGMLMFSQAESGAVLLLSAAVIGLGYGNYQSAGQAIAVKGVPPHRLGLATSTYMIFFDLGFGLGPYVSGLIVPFTGYRGLYAITVGVVMAAVVLYHFVYGRKAATE